MLTDEESATPEGEADNVLDVVEGEEGQAPAVEGEGAEGEDGSSEADELVISIGDEELPKFTGEDAPSWVKELRRENAAKRKRIKELEEQLSQGSITEVPKLGEKPTLESCDYDPELFEQRLSAWWDDKRKADAEQENARKAQEAAEQAWQTRLEVYQEGKKALKVADYDEVEELAIQLFDETQRGIVIHGADNAALLTYAIGKDRARAEKLAAIKDPVQFAFAVAKLEAQLKVTNRTKGAPPPEKALRSSGTLAASTDSTLNKLREEAERSGDYSKVMRYKAQMRAKA